MRDFKLFGVLHLADIMWIVLLIALIPVGIRFSMPREVAAHTGDTVVRFTVELGARPADGVQAPRAGFYQNITIGDPVFDGSIGLHLGTIVDAYAQPFQTRVFNEAIGTIAQAEVEGLELTYVVIESGVTISDYETLIGNFPISVGRNVAVRSKSFAGAGYIVSVERVR